MAPKTRATSGRRTRAPSQLGRREPPPPTKSRPTRNVTKTTQKQPQSHAAPYPPKPQKSKASNPKAKRETTSPQIKPRSRAKTSHRLPPTPRFSRARKTRTQRAQRLEVLQTPSDRRAPPIKGPRLSVVLGRNLYKTPAGQITKPYAINTGAAEKKVPRAPPKNETPGGDRSKRHETLGSEAEQKEKEARRQVEREERENRARKREELRKERGEIMKKRKRKAVNEEPDEEVKVREQKSGKRVKDP